MIKKFKMSIEIKKKIPLVFLFLLLIVIFANYGYTALINIVYPFDIGYDEGEIIHSLKISRGKFSKLYTYLWDEPILTTTDNPPLFYLITGSLMFLFGENISVGRIAPIFFSLLIPIIIYKILRKRDLELFPSMTFSLLVFSFSIIFSWFPILRVDSMAIFFSLMGIWFFLRFEEGRKRKYLHLSSFAFILSLYTKQVSIAAPLAVLVYLFFNKKERGIGMFLKDLTFMGGIPFLILSYLTGGAFFQSIFINNSSWGNEYFFLLLSKLLPFYAPLVLLSFIYIYKNRGLFSIYFLFSLGIGIILSQRYASWHQHFLEFTIALVLIIGLFYKKEEKRNFSLIILLLTLFHVIFMISNHPHMIYAITNPERYSSLRNLENDKKIFEYIKNSEGNVFSDHFGLPVLAGKKPLPEYVGMLELVHAGLIEEEDIIYYMKKEKIKLIVYRNEWLERYKKIYKYITNNYELVGKVKYYEDYNKKVYQNWKIYRKD
jgi:hypothetical protein